MCTPDGKCAAGKCRAGFGACGPATNGCTDDLSKPATCQGCLTACGAAAPKCAPTGCIASCSTVNLTDCSGACVDTKTSPTNCGACGKVCPTTANGDPTCTNGSCTNDCRQGFGHCDGNPNGPCVALTVFYPDVDADGYGDATKPKPACNAAAAGQGYVAQGGDCHDGNNKVRPGQTQYFTDPYQTPTGGSSYDYNCDGVEAEQPGVAHFTSCGSYPSCTTPTNAYRPTSRTGTNVNAYCGADRYAQCGADQGSCDVNSASAPKNGCR
jgi:hypothetical protein